MNPTLTLRLPSSLLLIVLSLLSSKREKSDLLAMVMRLQSILQPAFEPLQNPPVHPVPVHAAAFGVQARLAPYCSVPPAGFHTMLPERSISISASGDVDVVNSISSPVGGAGACADDMPAKDRMHALIKIKNVKILVDFI
jgi:hypothetical protein